MLYRGCLTVINLASLYLALFILAWGGGWWLQLDRGRLKGFKGSGVLEIVENFDGDTYRAVYTVSELLRGKLSGFSTESLFRFLNALGSNVEIRIVANSQSTIQAQTHVITT